MVALKSPAEPTPLHVDFAIPDTAPARRVTLVLDGREAAARTFDGPGRYTLVSAGPVQGTMVEVVVDHTFRAPGDARDLGIVLEAVGFAR